MATRVVATRPLGFLSSGMIRIDELAVGAIRLSAGAVVAALVSRLTRRVPWPRPFRWRFAVFHLVVGPLAALSWVALSTPFELLLSPSGTDLRGIARVQEVTFLGTFLYGMIV